MYTIDMLNLLILPGNSPGNKDWTRELSELFHPQFEEIKIIEYESWRDNDFSRVIDLEQELAKVSEVVREWDQYCVFAKSVGTALCMKAVHDRILNPQKCVFLGIPLNWLATNKIPVKNWVGTYNIPTMVIQQRNDPFAGSDTVGEFLKDLPTIKEYIVVEGDDHKYGQIDEIAKSSLKYFQN